VPVQQGPLHCSELLKAPVNCREETRLYSGNSAIMIGVMPSLHQDGAEIRENYLSAGQCEALLQDLESYKAAHELPLIERVDAGRSLRYRVIDGDTILQSLPRVVSLYRDVLALVRQSEPQLEPLSNQTAGLNVNFTPPGGEYRWHYDRNSVTAILFLNSVQGGQTEMYPHYRLHLGKWKDTSIQRFCDSALRRLSRFVKPLVIDPAPGRMILMRGDRCLHSVRRVEGSAERLSVIMSFDPPGRVFLSEGELDSYLYSRNASPNRDPNYRG
jgi:hypothetical protein